LFSNFKIRNKKRFIIVGCAILFLFSQKLVAQTDSCNIRISLLTVAPGEELYSTFGHSALRITDTVTHQDIVYNYGTFNFDDPDFYTKFVRGKLMYYLSTDDFQSFQYQNQVDNRVMTEQVLQLSCAEKQNVIMLLEANMMAQNRFYKYDFLFDNCTTRLRDLVGKATDSAVHFGNVLQAKTTFRDLIHVYLNNNDKQWSKLGIDILLGSKTDAQMSNYEVMFLPDYLLETFDSSTVHGRPLVSEKESLYKIDHTQKAKNNLVHPLFIFVCLFLLVAFLSFSKKPFIQRTLNSFDGFLFFVTGLLGVLLLFMWFGTDHIMCRNNYNLLWAWPTNMVAAFYIQSKKTWVKIYFLVYCFFLILLLAGWSLVPQHLNIALIPILSILIFRTLIFIFQKKSK
jgi:hypothetical protein